MGPKINQVINHNKKIVSIDGETLTIDAIELVAKHRYIVALTDSAKKKISRSREYLNQRISSGEPIYGVNTGFGYLANKPIDDKNLKQLQMNIVRSHAVGVGSFLKEEMVRAVMLLRANVLAKGYSGVRLELVTHLVDMLNKGIHPIVPIKGSVGASGDLSPLAHIALVLIGEGEAIYEGQSYHGDDALRAAGMVPISLCEKEGLSLINGTQFSTGIAVIHFINACHLISIADLASAMTLEAVMGSHKAFDERIQKVRPHPGQIKTAKNLRGLLAGSEIKRAHERCDKVQDAYSLRCTPQVHGAVRDVLDYVEKVLNIEINSSTDNPLVFSDSDVILSGGNFHAEPIAFATDFLGIAISELASISERRIDKLMNPILSGHPAFLAKDSGLNSGLMNVQVAAAALVSENKLLASPASVDSIPTSADKEDHVSMSAFAAVKLGEILDNTRDVLSMEILCAFQGLSLLLPLKPSKAIQRVYQIIRDSVDPIEKDRPFYQDLRMIKGFINDDTLIRHIRHQKR